MRRDPIVLLGLVTCLPALSLVATLVQMLDTFAEMTAAQGAVESETISRGVSDALGPSLIGLIVMVPLVVFYVWHAATRARLESVAARVIWIVLLVFVAPFSMPVYWYAHVWAPLPSTVPRSGE
jgi:biopolymer transport protein ExbB/TolQ